MKLAIDRRLLKGFDWGLPVVAIIISLISIATIYSATRPVIDSEQQSFYLRQLYWFCFGFIGFLFIIMIDYRHIIRFAYILFMVGVAMLIIVIFFGRAGMGAQRWLMIGPLSFQPSEFFKILFIITLSRYLSETAQHGLFNLKELLKIFAIFVVIPFILIIKQPDLGTAVMLILFFITMVMVAGVKKRIAILTIIVCLISIPFIGNIMWDNLRDYQKHRLAAFIEPSADPRGVGYHIIQSKVTIGSGGLFGKGYMKGTQGPLRFLPERHTDFIFSIFAEEWGFIGCVFLFGLYIFLLMKGFDTAKKARDIEGRFLALGATSALSFYFIINVGMTLGMVPVVGIPLPFFSYGGTAMLSNFIALGIIENVRMRRSFALY